MGKGKARSAHGGDLHNLTKNSAETVHFLGNRTGGAEKFFDVKGDGDVEQDLHDTSGLALAWGGGLDPHIDLPSPRNVLWGPVEEGWAGSITIDKTGKHWRAYTMDEKIDLERLTREGGGASPAFLTKRPEIDARATLAHSFGDGQMDNIEEVGRRIDLDLTLTEDTDARYGTDAAYEKAKARAQQFASINLMQGLSNDYPRLRSVLNDAKAFTFDQTAMEKVVELSKTDWREWMPRAVNPFPVTLFQFDSDHFQMILRKQSDRSKQALKLVGITGALIVGGHVIPLQKVLDKAHPMLGYGMLPTAGRTMSALETLVALHGASDNPEGDRAAIGDTLKGLWGDKDYTDKYGAPDDLQIQFLPEGGAQQLRWDRASRDMSIWNMAITSGAIRRACAAMALINADNPIIELGQAGGRSGRTIWKGKSVPRYTTGPVRIIPGAERVRLAPAGEPDPDREIHHKPLHDVRAHSRTYHRGTAKEFTVTVNAHQRGDAALGDLTGPGRTYAVGDTAPTTAHMQSATGRASEQPDNADASEAVPVAPAVGDTIWHEDGSRTTYVEARFTARDFGPAVPEDKPPVAGPTESRDRSFEAALILADIKQVRPRVALYRG